MDLRLKVFESGVWVSVSMVAARAVRIGALIVLARLLEPSDFGLLAASLVPVAGLTIISRFGMGPALIASRDDQYQAGYHVLVMTGALGLCLALALALGAGAYAGIYAEGALEPLIRAMALMVLLDALAVAPEALLLKEMMFARHIVSTLAGVVLGAAVAIVLALSGAGAWSLAIGALTTSAVTFLGFAAFCPDAPRLVRRAWDGAVAKRLFSLACRNIASQILAYYNNHVDRLVIGRGLGLSPLGFYHQGFNVAIIPVHVISDVSSRVLLPAFSKIADERRRLATGFMSSLEMVGFLALPSAVAVFALAPEAVVVLLGSKWREAVAVIQVLAVMIVFRPMSRTASSLFQSLGVPQYSVLSSLTQALCITFLIFPALHLGIVGVASVIVFAYAAGFVQNMFMVSRKTGLEIDLKAIFLQLLPAVWSSAVLLAYLVFLKEMWRVYSLEVHSLAFLSISGVSGPVVYIVAAYLFQRRVVIEISHLLRRSVGATSQRLGPDRLP